METLLIDEDPVHAKFIEDIVARDLKQVAFNLTLCVDPSRVREHFERSIFDVVLISIVSSNENDSSRFIRMQAHVPVTYPTVVLCRSLDVVRARFLIKNGAQDVVDLDGMTTAVMLYRCAAFAIDRKFLERKALKSVVGPEVAEPVDGDEEAPEQERTAQRRRKIVMFVDDDENIRRFVSVILKRAGFNIVVCGSGSECLSKLTTLQPKALFLDMDMPEMDGLVVCRKIRSTYPNLQLPIVFLTAATQREAVVEAKRAGADGYMVKPIAPGTLIERADYWTGIR